MCILIEVSTCSCINVPNAERLKGKINDDAMTAQLLTRFMRFISTIHKKTNIPLTELFHCFLLLLIKCSDPE